MALSFPYLLTYLSDVLKHGSFTPELRRNDEMSGSGDGRIWAASLSRPIWVASSPLSRVSTAEAREISAKLYALEGPNKTFRFAPPSYEGPANGATGLGSVTVDSISADRTRVALTGFPANFELVVGDYLSISYGGGKQYFGMVAEGDFQEGVQRTVVPPLPFGVGVGNTVQLAKPFMIAVVQSFQPFTHMAPDYAEGAALTIIQKL